MKKNFFNNSQDQPDLFSGEEKIDKQSYLPAYAQLAQILRRRISNGTHLPGSRLPSEASLAKYFDVSAMTARQAIGVLAQEGLVNRIQGRGTFIKRLEIAISNFGLESLRNALSDKKNIEVRILKATIEKAQGEPKKILIVQQNDPLIAVERLILHNKKPLTFQAGYARFNPESPIVETMLDTDVLTDLFFEKSHSSFMKGEIRLLPHSLGQREATLLQLNKGENAFKLEHVFYDFEDQPTAFGWFIISPDKMPLISRVGVWNE
jgi:GntR family transcriptional regulator